jgi:hypothetical protein
MAKAKVVSEDPTEFYKPYEEHAKALRTWLVAYGVGAPVLLLTNEHLSKTFAAAADSRWVALAFLGGGALQVLLAALNKTLMWACYFGAKHPEYADSKLRFKVAYWISEQFWIDLIVDAASLTLFGWATWTAFGIALAVP